MIRVHSSGDFFDKVYAGKWLEIMKRCPKPRFYWYSRSWRVPSVEPVLREMAALRCCRGWYSVDSETSVPSVVPPGVRLAFLQVEKGERPGLANLTFRRRGLRKESRVGRPMVCPTEVPNSGVQNCGGCRKCWE